MVVLEEQGRKLAGWDARCASDGELGTMAVVLARLLSFIAIALAHVLCELDARGVTETEHGLTAASWLAREAGIPGRVGRRPLPRGPVPRGLPGIGGGAGRPGPRFGPVAPLADPPKPRGAGA